MPVQAQSVLTLQWPAPLPIPVQFGPPASQWANATNAPTSMAFSGISPEEWAKWAKKGFTEKTLKCSRARECIIDIEADPIMRVSLAAAQSSAGQVLQHCRRVLENHCNRLAPLMYKIGFTHDPCFRWHNRTFGYIRERCRWEGMVLMFASDDSTVAAYVEAAMIMAFMGFLVWLSMVYFMVFLYT